MQLTILFHQFQDPFIEKKKCARNEHSRIQLFWIK